MVVSAFVSYFKPASRGLIRRGPNGEAARNQQQQQVTSRSMRNVGTYGYGGGGSSSSRNWSTNNTGTSGRRWPSTRSGFNQSSRVSSKSLRFVTDERQQHEQRTDPNNSSNTFQKRKQFKAISILTSIAADFDVVADWLYYFDSSQHEGDSGDTLVPRYLLNILLASCILGTATWLILATDGRVITPFLKLLNVEGISTGYVLLFTVLVEDIPQVILTFLIDDYLESDQVSSFAMFNLCTSLYDAMIKIAESYDERYDIVETGAWCKETFRGHHSCVSAVAALPLSTAKRPDGIPWTTLQDDDNGDAASTRAGCTDWGIGGSKKAKTEAKDISPHFLSSSYDGTVRLWNPSSTHTVRKSYIRKFKCHKDWVTSVIILVRNIGYSPPTDNKEKDDDITVQSSKTVDTIKEDRSDNELLYFLTGSRDGTIKLYNIVDKNSCMRAYTSDSPVTSLASLDEVSASHFVSGHGDASARLWDTITGECLRVFRGHEKLITSVCSLTDSSSFLTGSDDWTIKAWDITSATKFHESQSKDLSGWESPTGLLSAGSFGESMHCSGLVVWDHKAPGEIREYSAAEERECLKSFSGHRGSVFCVATIEESSLFISGGADRRLKLWEFESGLCVRNFVGHVGAVSSVCVFDANTILSGSFDKTARMWDVDSGVCLRVFEHHKDSITGVASCGNGRTFLTTSKDSTIKLWTATNTSSMKQLMEESDVEQMEYA